MTNEYPNDGDYEDFFSRSGEFVFGSVYGLIAGQSGEYETTEKTILDLEQKFINQVIKGAVLLSEN